jgi:hypothetical protein
MKPSRLSAGSTTRPSFVDMVDEDEDEGELDLDHRNLGNGVQIGGWR